MSVATQAVAVAVALERRFEGCRLRPYLDSVGVPTIGFGATFYKNGVRVRLTDPAITRAEAEDLLLWHTQTVYLPAVLRLCPKVTDPDYLAALIDWTFNLGPKRLEVSTLRKLVNSGRRDLVPAEMMKWVYAGGRPLRGLVLRRREEGRLVSGGE